MTSRALTLRMSNGSGKPRKSISRNTKRMAALLALIWLRHFKALTLTTLQRIRQLKTQKLYMHVDGRQKKGCTVSRGRLCLMCVMRLSTMTMQLLLAQMSNRDGEAGMETMLRDISVIPNGTGQEIPYMFDIFHVFSSVAAFLIGVLALVCEEEMPPNIIPGESSGDKHFKLVLEVTPPHVHFVPKVLGLHLYFLGEFYI